eukprot:1353685-Prymnesium_polylepis.1
MEILGLLAVNGEAWARSLRPSITYADTPDAKVAEAAAAFSLHIHDCATVAQRGLCSIAAAACPVSC